MTTTASSLTIVKELRRLAQNPSHREYLLRNDVNSILIFVDPDEHPQEVVSFPCFFDFNNYLLLPVDTNDHVFYPR